MHYSFLTLFFIFCFSFCSQKGEIIVVWAYKNAQEPLSSSKHDERGFASITMISSGKATKLMPSYWKFSVALLSVATALLLQ